MPLVFSLPFCLLLPDGDYYVKIDKDEIVTLNLTKIIPKIFDERLPYRGLLKSELEDISTLKIWDEKHGSGGWVSIDRLKQINEKKLIIAYKTKDGKEIVPQIEPSIIEKDVDISQDINIDSEKFAQSLGQEKVEQEIINQMISEREKHGRNILVNAEVIRDPFGRFRYTKVKYTSDKELGLEEQFKEAINAVNILIARYRSITGDFWITKVREEDIFVYAFASDDSFDFSYTSKGFMQNRPDHSQDVVNYLHESLTSDTTEFTFTHLFLDAKNAFERSDYYLAVILSIVALESIIKTYLGFYSLNCPPMVQDEIARINLGRLVTNVLKKIFPGVDYKMIMKNVIPAIELRNDIIHGSEIDIPKDKAGKVIEDVGVYMEFIREKFKDFQGLP